MPTAKPAREAPFPSLLRMPPDAAHPAVANEPPLQAQNIQGNSLAGFNKDHQTLLFLKITDVASCKTWLKLQIPFIATLEQVIAFNRLFKLLRQQRGESSAIQATWRNIAFSFAALKQLSSDADDFTDAAFKAGLAGRSASLGDPTEATAEGHPSNWVIGGPGNEADILLMVASDDRDELSAEIRRIEESIYAARTPQGQPFRSGVQVLYKQHGHTLPPPLTGHEHFGFLDGVSQPGVRGRLSDDPTDVLTPRQNPNDNNQGKPGQDVLWPGEFVFGYAGQDPNAEDFADEGPVATAGPSWADDGSFVVFRRLRQDVPGFHAFLRETATTLGVNADLFGAKLVGRWQSGAPILRAPNADNKALADTDCANNNFEFHKPTPPIRPQSRVDDSQCDDANSVPPPVLFPSSPGDQIGAICPFAGHIRKAYPRDDQFNTPPSALNEVTTQTHRLLRRGIPFGDPYPPAVDAPIIDSGDRGLLFLAYQTSIERQFEFVTKAWVNNPNFKEPGSGFDPILGQNNAAGGNRQRALKVTLAAADGTQVEHTITLPKDWVIPTGGGYFFAPSIEALNKLSN